MLQKEVQIQETGMYDYGWRQYMPDLGRWFSMDQLSEIYHHTSPYGYVGNNPIKFADPNGKCKSDLQGNFPNEECAQPIEEVVLSGPKKPKNESIAQSPAGGWSGPSFLSELSHFFGGSGGGSSSGGGGGGGIAPVDPWIQYRKDLADYRLRQSRRILGAAEAKMFGKYASGFAISGNYGRINLTISLAYNWGTGQTRIFYTEGVKAGSMPKNTDIGFSVFQMHAFGEKNGEAYTNVFEGAQEFSTEISGSYFYGGSHSFSTSADSMVEAPYGTRTTSFNIGTGYEAGISQTYTTDVTQKINNAPSAIAKWLRNNIKYSPQFN